ncbi:hypothetical protein Tco_0417973 [Tanacetum coccineum]
MAEIGCNWARIGPSKSSQSLSIAHKWAVIYSLGSTSGIRACCEALNKKKQKQYTLDQFLSVKIEARTTTTTLTARLPILNPRDYDLWLMRIEQYFLMTNYSLWEVIKNGNKVLKKIVRKTKQEYEPTTAEEKQDMNAKLLMEAIEKRYGGNKESKKVQRTLLKQKYENFSGSSSEIMDQTFDRFNSSTNEADNTAYGVSAAHTQSNPTSGDNLSDDMICAFLASQPNSPQLLDLTGLKWSATTVIKMVTLQENVELLEIKEKRIVEELSQWKLTLKMSWFLKMESEGSSSSSDSEVDSCSKSCVKAYATLKEQYDSLSLDYKKSQFNLVSYKAGLESVEARLAHYKKNEVVFEESINVFNLEKFQNSSKSSNNLLESQVIDKFKPGLGYNAGSSTAASPAVESFVNSSEMLENQENNKSKSDKGYHAVPLPFTGNFIPFKPDLTFMDEIVKSENMDVITILTPSNGKKVESDHEFAGVKSNGDAVEPKTVRKNSFRPPVIED